MSANLEKSVECSMCWKKLECTSTANSNFNYLKTNFNKCKLHLETIIQMHSESCVDDGPSTSFRNNYVSLCSNCFEESAKLVSMHDIVEENRKQLRKIVASFATKILRDRKDNFQKALGIGKERVTQNDREAAGAHEGEDLRSDGVKQESESPILTIDIEDLKQNPFLNHVDHTSTQLDRNPGSKICKTFSAAAFNSASTSSAARANISDSGLGNVNARSHILPQGSKRTRLTEADLNLVSQSEEDFHCIYCDFVSQSHDLLMDHYISHTFPCRVCRMTFRTNQELVEHKRKNRSCYQCSQCSASFHSQRMLDSHIENEHGVDVQYEISPLIGLDTRRWKYFCNVCTLRFKKLKRFKIHRFTVHGEQNEFASKEQCVLCGKYMKNLEEHMIRQHTVGGQHACPVCGKRYFTANELKLHQTQEAHYYKVVTEPI